MNDYLFFNISDRTVDGYYSIPGGITHVFAFQILPNVSSNITVVHTAEYVQDFSLRTWFSKTPLDNGLFEQFDYLNPLYPLKHAARIVTFWDQNILNLPSANLTLDPTATYYINVQNSQASTNSYRLLLPS